MPLSLGYDDNKKANELRKHDSLSLPCFAYYVHRPLELMIILGERLMGEALCEDLDPGLNYYLQQVVT
jgi:hypothetical protein